jgi:very-short-patch-repair endonuclease
VFEVLSAYFPHFNIQVNVPMKSFDGCPSYIKRSSVDILVPELNLVVEINGEHHYRPMSYFSRDKAQARYEKQLKLDRMKRLFLEEAGYTVVVFSTDELDAAENTADLIIRDRRMGCSQRKRSTCAWLLHARKTQKTQPHLQSVEDSRRHT